MTIDACALTNGILAGDRRALAKGITLIESSRQEDQDCAEKLLVNLLPHSGKATILGITGIPGVGKSTFIETLGNIILKLGHKVAVLAVDPSSPVSGGSILGDRTRMQGLSANLGSFVRASPSDHGTGGIGRKTQEAILLVDAAGYDFVLVETIGVGQVEYAVADMVDAFVVLQMPNTGDGLQSLKKGILELADLIVINKCDGELQHAAQICQQQHQNALSFIHQQDDRQAPSVLLCSSLDSNSVAQVFDEIQKFVDQQKGTGAFEHRRLDQRQRWFDRELPKQLLKELAEIPKIKALFDSQREQVKTLKIPASIAVKRIIQNFSGNMEPHL
jgi:LAO/AO transport system kinase